MKTSTASSRCVAPRARAPAPRASRAAARLARRGPPPPRVVAVFAVATTTTGSPAPSDDDSPSRSSSTRRTRSSSAASRAPRVVVLGGGFGGLYTALKLDALSWDATVGGPPRPRVTLVDRADDFVFKPMLYELVNETMRPWEVAPSFAELLAPTAVRLVKGVAVDVREDDDAEGEGEGEGGAGVVTLMDGTTVPYDYLVCAVGANASDAGVAGAKDFAIPLNDAKDASRLAGALRDIERAADKTEDEARRRVAVVGGGLAGVELAGVVAERTRGVATVELFTPSGGIMRGAPSGQRAAATRVLRDAGVVMREGARVVAVEACADVERVRACGEAATVTVETSDGATTTEDFDVVAWTVGQRAVTPESWPFPRDSKGRIVTEDTLRVVGRSNVFALGDAAVVASSSSSNPNDSNPNDADFASPPPSEALPSTAQVAFQQADYAAWNVWSAMSSRPLLPFKYQHLGDMMTLGKTDAAVALPLNLAVVDGPAAAALRRAAYLYRMPTNEHRAKLAAEWIEQGARAALEEGPEVLRKLGVPLPPGLFPPPPSRE